MNKTRRREISHIASRLSLVTQRFQEGMPLDELITELTSLQQDIEDVTMDEEMTNDSMLEGSPYKDASDDAIDSLSDASGCINDICDNQQLLSQDDIIKSINDAIDYLTDATL